MCVSRREEFAKVFIHLWVPDALQIAEQLGTVGCCLYEPHFTVAVILIMLGYLHHAQCLCKKVTLLRLKQQDLYFMKIIADHNKSSQSVTEDLN